MRFGVTVGFALVLGAAGGLLASQALQAQQKPRALFIADVQEISDAAKFAEAAKKTGAQFQAHGGKTIVRTENVVQVSGTPPQRINITEFPNMDAARAWASDPKTKEVAGELDRYSKQRRFLVEAMQ
jgi:uncharacterized protein (DUF1330 family)